jgi:hypothetical protein
MPNILIAEALNDAFVLVVALSFATVLRAAVCVYLWQRICVPDRIWILTIVWEDDKPYFEVVQNARPH